jgi:hypothetical protein
MKPTPGPRANGADRRSGGHLLDEESPRPLRLVLGTLMAKARRADLAVARIRLGVVDLTPAEAGGLDRCRVLLGTLDVQSLEAGPTGGRAALETLRDFLASGRLLVRTSRTCGWTPDFSVFTGLPVMPSIPAGAVCLVGAHYFYQQPESGASLTAVIPDPRSIVLAARRFERLWSEADDVSYVVAETIERFLAAGP